MVLTERMQALGGHARSSHQRLLAERRQDSKTETRDRAQRGCERNGAQNSVQDSVEETAGTFESGYGADMATAETLVLEADAVIPAPDAAEAIIVDRIEAHLAAQNPAEGPAQDPAEDPVAVANGAAPGSLEDIGYELPQVPLQKPANDSAAAVIAEDAGAAGRSVIDAVAAETSVHDAHAQETAPQSAGAQKPGAQDAGTPAAPTIVTAGESDNDFAARRAVIHEWQNWSALNSDDATDPNAAAYFYRHLETKKPKLLDFPAEDRLQTVRTWLLAARCIKK